MSRSESRRFAVELMTRIVSLTCIPKALHRDLVARLDRDFSSKQSDSREGLLFLLTIIEQVHYRVRHPDYQSLCRELYKQDEVDTVRRRLKMKSDGKVPWDFWGTANRLLVEDRNPAETLYCVLNAFFWMTSDPRRAWNALHEHVVVTAQACCDLGNHEAAVEALHSVIAAPRDLSQAHQVRQWLEQKLGPGPFGPPLDPNVLLACVATLVRALTESSRFDAAECVAGQWLDRWLKPDAVDNPNDECGYRDDFRELDPDLQWTFIEAFANLLYLTGNEHADGMIDQLLRSIRADDPSGMGVHPPRRDREFFAVIRVHRAAGRVETALKELDGYLAFIVSGTERSGWFDRVRSSMRLGTPKSTTTKRVVEVARQLLALAQFGGIDRALHFATEYAETALRTGDRHAALCLPWELLGLPMDAAIPGISQIVFDRSTKDKSLSCVLPAVSVAARARRKISTPGVDSQVAAASMLRAACRDFSWLRKEDHGLDTTTILKTIELWLDLVLPLEPHFPFAVIDEFIGWHRVGHLRLDEASPYDRMTTVLGTSRLRAMILNATSAAALRVPSGPLATEIRSRALVWAAELQQRLAVERTYLGMESATEHEEGVFPTMEWPFGDASESDGQTPILDTWDMSHGEDRPSGDATKAWRDRVRELMGAGTSDRSVASSIPRDSVFLQLDFSEDGRPLWTAARSVNSTLEILATDNGFGEAGASNRIVASAGIHETIVNLMVSTAGQRARWRHHFTSRLEVVRDIHAELFSENPSTKTAGAQRLHALLKGLQGQMFVSPSLLAVTKHPGRGDSHQEARWNAFVHHGITNITDFLLEIMDPNSWYGPTVDPRCGRVALGKVLVEALHSFLSDVGRQSPFDALFAHLDPARTHLIVQANDAWKSVPTSFLPIGGDRLFERVRSIRSVVSLLLDRFAAALEPAEDRRSRHDGGLLCVSWFPPKEAARVECSKELHRQHQTVAVRHGLTYFGAAQNPAGTIGSLAAALKTDCTKVATVCGHGTTEGIALAPTNSGEASRWRGNGIDLASLELLVMVSCSLGQVLQSGQLDSDGFFVEQAIHRGRSAIACLWPVLIDEAIPFTIDVIDRFLTYRRNHGASEGWLRATALNDARKHVHQDTSAAVVKPYTIAAFELLGLG